MEFSIGDMSINIMEVTEGRTNRLRALIYIKEFDQYFGDEWTIVRTSDDSVSFYKEVLTLVSKSLIRIVQDIETYERISNVHK